MSECYLTRCQQERKFMRRELNKWTKNLLLQIGLETISKNHFQVEIDSFNQDETTIPTDFNPNQNCVFCVNRQECLSTKKHNQNKKHFFYLNDNINPEVNDDDENFPLDLSLKSTSNLNSHSLLDLQSDILPIYNPEEFFLSNPMNFNYFSQSFPNLNLFSSLPINQFNSLVPDDYISELAKQMAYLRMIEEIDNQRNNKKSKMTTNSLNTSSILTESMHVNQIINDIMTRTLTEIFEEQTRVLKQEELLFVKKQNNNKDDMTMSKTNHLHKHNNHLNPLPLSSSPTSRCSPSIHSKNENKSQSSTRISNRRAREILPNSKVIVGTDGKQIRPKRGQYRRYESEQLAKAVVAVLNNEMSVHKAGSYFGVPHSTLEYKVKERNSKMSTTTKTELSPSMSVNENNHDLTRQKSMDYDLGEENDRLSSYAQSKTGQDNSRNGCQHSMDDENESDDEEIQSYSSAALEMN